MPGPSSWWRRFSLHLAAAVGATGIFVAAAAVGAHQQSTVAGPVVVRTARPLRSPTPAAIASEAPADTAPASQPPAAAQPPAHARAAATPAQERGLSGTVRAVDADSFTLVTAAGREWHVRPAPGALLRLDGKAIRAVDALQVDDRVTALGIAEGRERFMAHAVTARRSKS